MLREEIARIAAEAFEFQRAPTLGGECYLEHLLALERKLRAFQRAPTLGGECYFKKQVSESFDGTPVSTGTHPWG